MSKEIIIEDEKKAEPICACEKRESRPSQWDQLLRQFSESNKEVCNNVQIDMPIMVRSLKVFPTGSKYLGTWDILGMSGKGTYTFPNGVIYEGDFEDGMFHGKGELRYPCGSLIRGKWQDGLMYERTLIFPDGLQYSEHRWRYCKQPDRRFTIEYDEGLNPAGESYLTAEQPTRAIPAGYYDTGDGFYDPNTKAIYNATDLTVIVRSPHEREQRWILKNCRTAPHPNIGPRKDLYEEWSVPDIDPRNLPIPAVPSGSATQPYNPPQLFGQHLESIIMLKKNMAVSPEEESKETTTEEEDSEYEDFEDEESLIQHYSKISHTNYRRS